MPQVWKPTPQFKLEVTDDEVAPTTTTITSDQAISIQVIRPECGISHAKLLINDYKSKNYITYFDSFHQLDISLRYGSDSWTKVFSGMINEADPQVSEEQGEVLGILAWGWEWALLKTNCSTSYGTQGEQAAIGGHPEDIIEDIITNYINKAFGSAGASTQWALDITDVETVDDAAAITYINCGYIDNYSAINRVCEITNAYAASQATASCHWYVDTDKHFRFKRIGSNAADGAWDNYWGGTSTTDPGTQASSTIVVHEDMIQYDFRKNIDEYANKVVLVADLRVPGYDYITEYNATSGTGGFQLWDKSADMTLTNDSDNEIVGSNCLRIERNAGVGDIFCWYPSAKNLNWDITKIGSINTIPSLNFYAKKSGAVTEGTIRLSDAAAANRWTLSGSFINDMPSNDTWYHFNFPIGPYFATNLAKDALRWNVSAGAPGWTDIDYIEIYFNAAVGAYLYIDDLHIAGKVIREAKDASEITAAKKEHQKTMRCDNAVDDLFKAGTPQAGGGGGPYTDLGTAARIAYAELLRRSQAPTVGLIQIPLAVDLLPGQKVHVHAAKQLESGVCAICGGAGTFRIASDFRVKELRHNIIKDQATTQLNLTNDVSNTFAFGVPNAYSLLISQLQGMTHGQARDLKSSGIDVLIPRLAESY